MTLQRINTVEIENFRSYSTKKVFNFEDGFNLISGENGAGKTSLRLAIVLGLFSRPGGKGLESIMRSGNKPVVKIEFVAEGGTYTIEKTFNKTPSSSTAILTNNDTGVSIGITEEAVFRCRQLVTGSEESTINKLDGNFSRLVDEITPAKKFAEGEVSKILKNNMGSLLFPEQGRLVELFETNDVLRNIGLDNHTLSVNNDLEKLLKRTNEEREKRLQPKKFDFKCDVMNDLSTGMSANGDLYRKFEISKELATKVAGYKKTESILQGLYTELESLKSSQDNFSEGENLGEMAKMLEESAEAHQIKRESAEERTVSLKKDLEDLEQINKDRESIIGQIDDLKTDVKVNKTKLGAERDNLNKCKEDYKASNKKITELKDLISDLDSWIDYKGEDSYRKDLQKRVTKCENELERINQNNKDIVELQQEIEGIKTASTEQWEQINDLVHKIDLAKGRLSPWSLDTSNPPDGYEVNVDGEVYNHKSGEIKSSLVMKDSKNRVILSISNPEESQSIEELESQLNQIFISLDAKGRPELGVRRDRYISLTADLDKLKNKEFRTKEDIDRDKLDLERKLKERKKKPKSGEPDGGLTELVSERTRITGELSAIEKIREDMSMELGGLQKSTETLEEDVEAYEKDIDGLKAKLQRAPKTIRQ